MKQDFYRVSDACLPAKGRSFGSATIDAGKLLLEWHKPHRIGVRTRNCLWHTFLDARCGE